MELRGEHARSGTGREYRGPPSLQYRYPRDRRICSGRGARSGGCGGTWWSRPRPGARGAGGARSRSSEGLELLMKELGGMREIIDRFIARLDEVVERCTTAIWEAVPAYARVGEDLMEDVRDAVRENVAILSRVLSQGRDVGRDDLEVIERTGARRAEAGIPLQDVLHAYRTVSRECWDILAEECRRQ